MYVAPGGSDFATKLLGYLQEADYNIARTEKERIAIYDLRYRAYLAEGAIEENPENLFYDHYDQMDNCWIFGVHIDGRLVGSIRCHLITPNQPYGPAYDVYPDIVRPMLDEGLSLVDPTRFVADKALSKLYPEIPYLALRAPCMTYDQFNADYCLASVRKEHRAFYRRVFRAEILCDPRPHPPLKEPVCLMATNVSKFRDKLLRRYPIFESSLTERRLLFAEPPVLQFPQPNATLLPDRLAS